MGPGRQGCHPNFPLLRTTGPRPLSRPRSGAEHTDAFFAVLGRIWDPGRFRAPLGPLRPQCRINQPPPTARRESAIHGACSETAMATTQTKIDPTVTISLRRTSRKSREKRHEATERRSSSDPTRRAKGSFLARSGCCSEREVHLRFCTNLEMQDRLSLHCGRGLHQDRSSMADAARNRSRRCCRSFT